MKNHDSSVKTTLRVSVFVIIAHTVVTSIRNRCNFSNNTICLGFTGDHFSWESAAGHDTAACGQGAQQRVGKELLDLNKIRWEGGGCTLRDCLIFVEQRLTARKIER